MLRPSTTTRRVAIGLAVGAAAFTLGACGGSSSSGGSSASGSAAALPTVSADATLASQVPANIKSSGKLTFGTDASYAPNEFIAEDGSTIVGVDVDLGNAIAARLGLQGQWSNANFDSLIVGVTNGKYDSSMSSFTINPEREKQVNMISYFNAGTQWAVAKAIRRTSLPTTPAARRSAFRRPRCRSTTSPPAAPSAPRPASPRLTSSSTTCSRTSPRRSSAAKSTRCWQIPRGRLRGPANRRQVADPR